MLTGKAECDSDIKDGFTYEQVNALLIGLIAYYNQLINEK